MPSSSLAADTRAVLKSQLWKVEGRQPFPLLLWPLVHGNTELKEGIEAHCLTSQSLTGPVARHSAARFSAQAIPALFPIPGCDH